jgi:hypothetical protein
MGYYYRRRGSRKQRKPGDLEVLGFYQKDFIQIFKDLKIKEIICSKCSNKSFTEKNKTPLFDYGSIWSGPYGLFFSCKKCEKYSSLHVKYDISKDKKLAELTDEIDNFSLKINKIKKVWNKVNKFWSQQKTELKNLKKPYEDAILKNEEILKELDREFQKLPYTYPGFWNSLAEEISLKDKTYTYVEGKRINIEHEARAKALIKKNHEGKAIINNLNQKLKKIDENKKKIIDVFPELKEELDIINKFCRTNYKMLSPLNSRDLEEIEELHYKPLIRQKEKRINLLKKIFRLSNAYIYVLGNSIMPDLYKIGWTERSPEERAKELSYTGLPEPFKVLYSKTTNLSDVVEKEIHEELDEYRYRSDREFFKADLNLIKQTIDKVLSQY